MLEALDLWLIHSLQARNGPSKQMLIVLVYSRELFGAWCFVFVRVLPSPYPWVVGYPATVIE